MTTLLFAGGGTGGHVFPMVAVADAVRTLSSEVELVFVGTARGLETKIVPQRGYRLELLEVAPIRGGGVSGAVNGVLRAARAIPEARALVRKVAPSAVFSIGGYAAGPVSVAARTLGVPLALMEPNCSIGLANRLVAPLVQRAYTAFPESARHFSKDAVMQTGVPLRAGFVPKPYPASSTLSVLVLGGSQGSEALNDAVPRALSRVSTPLRVVHQCGAGRDARVRALYAELGLGDRAQVVTFIDAMPEALAGASLVIGRAGANAVAEICAVGRPSLLVPYPFAGDHQRFNADSLVKAGAALCVLSADATPERLAAEVTRLASDAAILPAMARAARGLGRPDAARVIARDLLRLAGVADASATPTSSTADSTDPGVHGGAATAESDGGAV